MAVLNSSTITVAIAPLMNHFEATAARAQWLATIFFLSMSLAVPVAGWLGDRLGLKRIYLGAVALFTVTSVFATTAGSLTQLIGYRLVQGLAAGTILPVSMGVIYLLVPRGQIGSAIGLFSMCITLAPAIGPTIGGYFIDHLSWRAVFALNIPVGLLGLWLGGRFLPFIPARGETRFDSFGFVTVTIGLFALLYALSEGPAAGWSSPLILGLLGLSVAFLAIFGWWERRVAEPLLDLAVFRYRSFVLSSLVLSIAWISLYSGVFYMPLYLQNIRGLDAATTGLTILPAAVLMALASQAGGRLYDRVGARPVLLTGLAALTLTTFLFHFLTVTTAVATIVVWQAIRGLSMGLLMAPSQASSLEEIPTALISRATAVSNVIQRVAASLGLAVLTAFLHAREVVYGGPPPVVFTRALGDMFLVSVVLALAAMIPAALLKPAASARAVRD